MTHSVIRVRDDERGKEFQARIRVVWGPRRARLARTEVRMRDRAPRNGHLGVWTDWETTGFTLVWLWHGWRAELHVPVPRWWP